MTIAPGALPIGNTGSKEALGMPQRPGHDPRWTLAALVSGLDLFIRDWRPRSIPVGASQPPRYNVISRRAQMSLHRRPRTPIAPNENRHPPRRPLVRATCGGARPFCLAWTTSREMPGRRTVLGRRQHRHPHRLGNRPELLCSCSQQAEGFKTRPPRGSPEHLARHAAWEQNARSRFVGYRAVRG